MKLVILIGTSGSGKSYYASELKKRYPDWRVISSDRFRLENHGYINFLHKPLKVFHGVDTLLMHALYKGDNVIYDACNLTRFRRKHLIKWLRGFKDLQIIGVVFNTDMKTCILQDKSSLRQHHVGKYIIFLMKLLFWFNRPTLSEGYNLLTTPKAFIESMKELKE